VAHRLFQIFLGNGIVRSQIDHRRKEGMIPKILAAVSGPDQLKKEAPDRFACRGDVLRFFDIRAFKGEAVDVVGRTAGLTAFDVHLGIGKTQATCWYFAADIGVDKHLFQAIARLEQGRAGELDAVLHHELLEGAVSGRMLAGDLKGIAEFRAGLLQIIEDLVDGHCRVHQQSNQLVSQPLVAIKQPSPVSQHSFMGIGTGFASSGQSLARQAQTFG
jgi:hypothetical protein